MTANLTTVQAALKQRYPYKKVQRMLYEMCPLLGMIPKDESAGGEHQKIPIQIAPTGGGSRTFARAQANKVGSNNKAFLLTLQEDYSLFSITTKTWRAMKSDMGAFLSALELEGDAAWNTANRSISISSYRNTGGARGQIASGSGTDTIQLSNPADAVNFEVNMKVVSFNTDGTTGSPGVQGDGELLNISAIDRNAGTITQDTTATWATGGNFSANDFIFRDGDVGISMSGLEDWLPEVAPVAGGGDSHYGVDRGVDPVRLAGNRHVATASDGTVEDFLIRVASEISQVGGGKPDCAFINPILWRILNQEIGSKDTYERVLAQGENGKLAHIGYKAIILCTDSGDVKVLSDRNCPRDAGYMLQMDTWKMFSLGEAPGWLDDDGSGKFLREGSADALEGRLGMFGNLATNAPGFNGRMNLSHFTA